MNRKQFLILAVLVVIVGAAGLVILRNRNQSWQGGATAMGQKLLPNLPINDVAQITIKAGDAAVNLARDNNLWRVRERGNYPANFSQISELLMKLSDLKVAQSVEAGPSQLGRFELLPAGAGADTGTEVDLKDAAGKTVGSVLLGKKHMKKPAGASPMGGMGDDSWPDGRYVMTANKSIALVSDPLDSVQAKPEQWLSKDFLNVEKPRTIAVKFPAATNSWKLTRASETADWQLADGKPGEKLDSSKISSVTSPLSSASFNDVSALGTAAAGTNTVLTIETFDGFNYVAKIGAKQDDNYAVTFAISANLPTSREPAKDEKAADKANLDKAFQAQQKTLADKLAKEQALTNWVYQMPTYSLDEVLKTRQQLLVEATNAPAVSPSAAKP